MKQILLIASLAAVALTACQEQAEAPAVVEEKFGDYEALGTEPGWNVSIKNETITFTSQIEKNFELPVDRAKKTATGWEVRGFSDTENVNLSIAVGKECNDGMSDRSYADTVKVSAGGFGTQEGCGGAVTEAAEAETP